MDEELLVLTLREQRDLADRRAEYFAAMAYTIAKQAKLSEDEISEIRAKVRPQHGASWDRSWPASGTRAIFPPPGSADRTALPTSGSICHCKVGGCVGKDD